MKTIKMTDKTFDKYQEYMEKILTDAKVMDYIGDYKAYSDKEEETLKDIILFNTLYELNEEKNDEMTEWIAYNTAGELDWFVGWHRQLWYAEEIESKLEQGEIVELNDYEIGGMINHYCWKMTENTQYYGAVSVDAENVLGFAKKGRYNKKQIIKLAKEYLEEHIGIDAYRDLMKIKIKEIIKNSKKVDIDEVCNILYDDADCERIEFFRDTMGCAWKELDNNFKNELGFEENKSLDIVKESDGDTWEAFFQEFYGDFHKLMDNMMSKMLKYYIEKEIDK